MPSGTVASKGVSKDSVNYRNMEKCGTCMYFYPLNSCLKVAGNISPEAVCNLWAMKEKQSGMDGSDYLKEYSKNPTEAAKNLPYGGT